MNRYRYPNISSPKMTDLLKTSVYEYLELFGTRENFSGENAFQAMTNHYKDIHMVDFYLKRFPKEEFYLITDKLSISIRKEAGYPIGTEPGYHKAENLIYYKKLSFCRAFAFEELLDETIEIHFNLYYENSQDKFNTNVSLQKDDLVLNEYVNDEQLDEILENKWYQQYKGVIPVKYELYINYNF